MYQQEESNWLWVASEVTRFNPFGFISFGVGELAHNGLKESGYDVYCLINYRQLNTVFAWNLQVQT